LAETAPNQYCPTIAEIKKNKSAGNWTAQTQAGFWKSYDVSLATNLTRFVGAQWTGEKIGQVTCVYESEQRFTIQGNPTVQPTIPVTLAFHTLTFQPTEGKWKHVKPGVYNCYTEQERDCPFLIHTKSSVGNIYDEAESLKSKAKLDTLQQPTH